MAGLPVLWPSVHAGSVGHASACVLWRALAARRGGGRLLCQRSLAYFPAGLSIVLGGQPCVGLAMAYSRSMDAAIVRHGSG